MIYDRVLRLIMKAESNRMGGGGAGNREHQTTPMVLGHFIVACTSLMGDDVLGYQSQLLQGYHPAWGH